MDDTIRRHHGQVPGSAALDGRSSAMAGRFLFFDAIGAPGGAARHDWRRERARTPGATW
jgi:hypothetical protein